MSALHSVISFFAAASGECGTYRGVIDTTCVPHPAANASTIQTILNIVFAITASVALLMIVIGGFRYITASGDPAGTAQARKTIIYSIVGLLVTMAAYSIVFFVIRNVA